METRATHNGTLQTVGVLHRVVAVVPGASILCCIPAIYKVIVRCNWALSDAVDTVHVHGLILPYSVPVDTCAVMVELIYNLDMDSLQDS